MLQEANFPKINSAQEAAKQEMSLSHILKSKRQQLKLEESDVAAYLKIKARDVEAIENSDVTNLARHLYVPGLLRSYAKFLQIDPQVIEEKIKLLHIESNTNNKKHQLINIGENIDLTPTRDSVHNLLLISVLLFFTLLSIYNFYENSNASISSETLVEEFKKIDL